MPAINDAALTNEYPDELDETAFANQFMGEEDDSTPEEGDDAPVKKPSKKTAVEDDNEQTNDDDEANDEDASDESPEDEAEGDEDGEDQKKAETSEKKFADDSDDTYVKVKVGDDIHEVKVKDLQRLYGQEASLTRKSQEVAEERKAIDTKRAENIAAYDVLLKRATERADQYRALPWTQLLKDPDVPADQLQALQAEAAKAVEDETFLKTELGNFMQSVTKEQEAARRTAAQACLKALNDTESPHHIKGWNDALYNDVRQFSTEMGLPVDMVNSITDASAIKLLHMAMQFHRGKSKVVVTKKVNKTPTKIVKSSASAPATRGTPQQVSVQAAKKQAKQTGSLQDAANAFEAMMGDE
jgi:hypothetical protein